MRHGVRQVVDLSSSTKVWADCPYLDAGKIVSVMNGAIAPATSDFVESTDSFVYTDVAHPSAVTGVSHTTGSTTSSDMFGYDTSGRMITQTAGVTPTFAGTESPRFYWRVSSPRSGVGSTAARSWSVELVAGMAPAARTHWASQVSGAGFRKMYSQPAKTMPDQIAR